MFLLSPGISVQFLGKSPPKIHHRFWPWRKSLFKFENIGLTRGAFPEGGAFPEELDWYDPKKFRAFSAIINKSMVLYCFVCFYCLLGYLYRRRRKIFALLTLFLQFLLLKQCISKGFGDHKPPKIFAACGWLSVKKAPLWDFPGIQRGAFLSGGQYLWWKFLIWNL